MKLNKKLLIIPILLLSPVFLCGLASAQSTTTTADAKALSQRLEQRKLTTKTKLVASEQIRLKARCKASQVILSATSKHIDGVVASHTKAYESINTSLSQIVTKLNTKGLNTTNLAGQQVTLASKIKDYQTNLTEYRQSVADLASMDCVSDPTAFKATLESSRSLRDKLSASILDIKSYVTGTIKPTLTTLRSDLNKKNGTTDAAGAN
jgi:chromosome segregation ATPase